MKSVTFLEGLPSSPNFISMEETFYSGQGQIEDVIGEKKKKKKDKEYKESKYIKQTDTDSPLNLEAQEELDDKVYQQMKEQIDKQQSQ